MFDMTELSKKHTSERTKTLLRRRRASELWLKGLGIAAIGFAVLALVALCWSVFGKAAYALYEYYVVIDTKIELSDDERARVEDPNPLLTPDLGSLLRESFRGELPAELTRAQRREFYGILSSNAGIELGQQVKRDPSMIGRTVPVRALMDDDAQLYLKGVFGRLERLPTNGILSPLGTEGEIQLLSSANDFSDELQRVKEALLVEGRRLRRQAAQQDNAVEFYTDALEDASPEERTNLLVQRDGAASQRDRLLAEAAALEARAYAAGGEEQLSDQLPSLIVNVNGGWARATAVRADRLVAEVIEPLESTADAPSGSWSVYFMETPQAARRVSDRQIVWIEQLRDAGVIERQFNWRFFTSSDSRDAELAGIYGALVGTFWTMLVTFLLAFPIGVAASVYLEEFAPKNRITGFIEVNINNLAAVPSIVFGLLGLAVVLPVMSQLVGTNLRSASLIGGTVLALMSLPTIIIAARAAIKAVPPSIREAALGVGASKLQTVTHHVLPLAMPGILTGTIIALAQALGETAPLIMIGMVAFIVDVPTGVTSSATVLPVQVFRWSDFPEKLFEFKTALAIVSLLAFLVVMNALAVVLRKRFERRW